MFEDAYRALVELTKRYEESRARAKGARRVTAKLAMALLRAGLPMSVMAWVGQDIGLGRFTGRQGYFIKLKRPRGVFHEYFITEDELRSISELARQVRGLYSTDASLVRSLEYELRSFREAYDLHITPLDVYALKLWVHGMMDLLSGKYSARRLRMVAEHILSRAAVLGVARQ